MQFTPCNDTAAIKKKKKNVFTVVSRSPSDDRGYLTHETFRPLHVGRQTNGLDVIAEADGSLQFEESQIVVETRTGELRMNSDFADLENLALARIGCPKVVFAETGRVLRRPES